jgi:hypothetical protein
MPAATTNEPPNATQNRLAFFGEKFNVSTAPRVIKSQNDELPRDVEDLAQAVAQLPLEYRQSVEPLLARVLESTSRRRRILSLVQDALGQLRMDMKYLMFDLEATRRERDTFKQQLEEQG